MGAMLLAGIIWVVTHLGLSSTPLRGQIVSRLGEQAFLGIYSLVAFGTLGYLIYVYTVVPHFDYLWTPNLDLYWIAKLTMPIACIFIVGSFMANNPTMVGGKVDADAAEPATGVFRITRHPLQWGFIIWAIGHIIANGDVVSIIFFTSLFLVSLLGTYGMDSKKAKSTDEAWPAYVAVTSNLPFGALLSGRNRLVMRELWLPVVVGLVLFAILYVVHEYIAGVKII